MTTTDAFTSRDPRQWCVSCGKPLWEWSAIYWTATLAGKAVLCRDCSTRYADAQRASWDMVLVGYKDILRWNRGRKGSKS